MNVEIVRDSNGGSLFSCENVFHHFVLFPFTLKSDIADLSHVICMYFEPKRSAFVCSSTLSTLNNAT